MYTVDKTGRTWKEPECPTFPTSGVEWTCTKWVDNDDEDDNNNTAFGKQQYYESERYPLDCIGEIKLFLKE